MVVRDARLRDVALAQIGESRQPVPRADRRFRIPRGVGEFNAVNCYSPTEDILENPSVLKVFGMAVGETTGGIRSNQELFKGCAVWYGVNSVTFAGTRIEGGWGVNANYMANPLWRRRTRSTSSIIGFGRRYWATRSQRRASRRDGT